MEIVVVYLRIAASGYRAWGAEASWVSPFRCGMLLVLSAKCMISIGKHKIELGIINTVF